MRSSFFGLIVIAALLCGCASIGVLRLRQGESRAPELALRDVLDRAELWANFGSRTRISIRWNGKRVSTRGHVLYLMGERYEIGFRQAHGSQIGTLYITPAQTIYWDDMSRARVFGVRDTSTLRDLLQLELPNWDPRDLLPFPVSGRSGGFQVDSIVYDRGDAIVYGTADHVRHVLRMTGPRRLITEERVERPGRAPLIKSYSRVLMVSGWPIARRVCCRDDTGAAALNWSMTDIVLKAGAPHAAESRAPVNSNPPHP